jgi:hypothetical protein
MLLRIAALLVVLVIALSIAGGAHAQVEHLKTDVTGKFGESVTFKATARSIVPITAAVVYFQAEGDTRTNVGLAEVRKIGSQTYLLTYSHKISDYYLRPFVTVRFHWELVMADEEEYMGPFEEFEYRDDRFDWKSREKGHYRVHWYEGDLQFAQDILEIAQDGGKKIQDLLQMPEPEMIDIYIYADPDTLKSALQIVSESWIAGHADPDLGVILVSLPDGPEQRLLAEQRIPHELMHVMLYRSHTQGYDNFPIWLNEGLASLAELYPNPDYRILLDEAAAKGELLPITALCDAFPTEASGALLSYAESQSFTRYLHSSFGRTGLATLVNTYANGLDCEKGAEQALGESLTQLDRSWQRDALSQNFALKALLNLLPWIILLIMVIGAPLALVLLRTGTTKPDQPAR